MVELNKTILVDKALRLQLNLLKDRIVLYLIRNTYKYAAAVT